MMTSSRPLFLLLIFTMLAISTGGCSPRNRPVRAPRAPRAATTRPVAYADRLPIPDTLALSADSQQSVQILGHAEAFGGEAVGYSGEPLPEIVALRALVAEPQAAEMLKIVIEHGTLAGQLMALTGLYFADPSSFTELLERYRDSPATVRMARGGCNTETPLRLVRELVHVEGAMQMQGPNDTFSTWIRRNHVPSGTAITYDIAGGGYPHVFLGR